MYEGQFDNELGEVAGIIFGGIFKGVAYLCTSRKVSLPLRVFFRVLFYSLYAAIWVLAGIFAFSLFRGGHIAGGVLISVLSLFFMIYGVIYYRKCCEDVKIK